MDDYKQWRREFDEESVRICEYMGWRHGSLPWWDLWGRLSRMFSPKFPDGV